MEAKAYQLEVTLRGARPPIWRRLEVKGDTKLSTLHQILQVAMGWTDSHLHQFLAKDKIYGTPDPDFFVDCEDERKVPLDQALQTPKDRIVYEYDFGDSWEHEVVGSLEAAPLIRSAAPVRVGRRSSAVD